jgi:hypothetical protein
MYLGMNTRVVHTSQLVRLEVDPAVPRWIATHLGTPLAHREIVPIYLAVIRRGEEFSFEGGFVGNAKGVNDAFTVDPTTLGSSVEAAYVFSTITEGTDTLDGEGAGE